MDYFEIAKKRLRRRFFDLLSGVNFVRFDRVLMTRQSVRARCFDVLIYLVDFLRNLISPFIEVGTHGCDIVHIHTNDISHEGRKLSFALSLDMREDGCENRHRYNQHENANYELRYQELHLQLHVRFEHIVHTRLVHDTISLPMRVGKARHDLLGIV